MGSPPSFNLWRWEAGSHLLQYVRTIPAWSTTLAKCPQWFCLDKLLAMLLQNSSSHSPPFQETVTIAIRIERVTEGEDAKTIHETQILAEHGKKLEGFQARLHPVQSLCNVPVQSVTMVVTAAHTASTACEGDVKCAPLKLKSHCEAQAGILLQDSGE